MKQRFIIAVILLGIVAATLVFELVYVGTTTELLENKLETALECVSRDDFEGVKRAFDEFEDEYFARESAVSLFIHDSVIEDIHALVDETQGLMKTGETGEVGGNIENLLGKVRDFYLSMLPNVRNLM